MPEGPEVRRLAENLNDVLSGKYLLSFLKEEFSHFRNLESIPVPNRLHGVTSRGKKIIFEFENGFLLSSLGLEGGWYLSEREKRKSSTLFDSVWAEETGSGALVIRHVLCYDDTRHFGWLEFFSTKEEMEERCDVGLDLLDLALQGALDYEQWKKALLRGRKSPICTILMEQKYVASIGNYLRSDILYDAEIDPLKITGELTESELKRLFTSSEKLVVKSYRQGGAKGSYTDLYGTCGGYECLVYGKKTSPCGRMVRTFKDKNGRTVWTV